MRACHRLSDAHGGPGSSPFPDSHTRMCIHARAHTPMQSKGLGKEEWWVKTSLGRFFSPNASFAVRHWRETPSRIDSFVQEASVGSLGSEILMCL